MRKFQLCLLFFVLFTAVSCISGSDSELPTQVPTAVLYSGPPGLGALNAPWGQLANPTAGLSIDHPQDWTAVAQEDSIRLVPLSPADAPNNLQNPPIASLSNFPAADSTTSIVAVLESMITSPDLGPPETVTRVSAPTAVSVGDYTAAAAQIQVKPPDISLIESVPESENADTPSGPASLNLYIVAIRHEDRTVVFTGSTTSNLMEDYLPVFKSMVQTIQITLPQAE